jgi:hypothetical protein
MDLEYSSPITSVFTKILRLTMRILYLFIIDLLSFHYRFITFCLYPLRDSFESASVKGKEGVNNSRSGDKQVRKKE